MVNIEEEDSLVRFSVVSARVSELLLRPISARKIVRMQSAIDGVPVRKLSKAFHDSYFESRTANQVDEAIENLLSEEAA